MSIRPIRHFGDPVLTTPATEVMVFDGSLRTRFQGIAAAGRLRLKTGQLTGVRALAGYATGRDGARWIIVILHNHPLANGPVGIDLQHQLLQSVLRP